MILCNGRVYIHNYLGRVVTTNKLTAHRVIIIVILNSYWSIDRVCLPFKIQYFFLLLILLLQTRSCVACCRSSSFQLCLSQLIRNEYYDKHLLWLDIMYWIGVVVVLTVINIEFIFRIISCWIWMHNCYCCCC